MKLATISRTPRSLPLADSWAEHLRRSKRYSILLRLKPDIARTARDEYAKWFVDRDIVEHIMDGLRKAGLDVPPSGGDD